jgi:general secretion pathway protein A
MDYLAFWNIKERAFDDLRNPRFYFESEDHQEALERLSFLCRNKAMNMGMLTGEIGCGKTITRTVLEARLELNEFAVASFPNSNFNSNDLIYGILEQIKLQNIDFSGSGRLDPHLRQDKYGLVKKLEETLEILHGREHRHLVVIFDEAQQMEVPALEEIKNLTNLNSTQANYLTVILVGQPELREKIRGLKQIDQRISLRFHLNTLDRRNTGRYIRHRLQIAGSPQQNIFTQEALEQIYTFTQGIPREINRVAKLSMEMGAAAGQKEISAELTETVIRDLKEQQGFPLEDDADTGLPLV